MEYTNQEYKVVKVKCHLCGKEAEAVLLRKENQEHSTQVGFACFNCRSFKKIEK